MVNLTVINTTCYLGLLHLDCVHCVSEKTRRYASKL